MKGFLSVVGFGTLYVLSSLWYGCVLSVMWSWFVVRAFHITPLSIPLALGVSMIFRLFTYQYDPKKETNTEDLIKALLFAFVYPLIALGLGAIIHAFVA